MLQQTRVSTVVEYYDKWMKKWPTIQDLSKANLEEVNQMWSGLGYYRRATFLHKGAVHLDRTAAGRMPRTAKELETIPGIGTFSTILYGLLNYIHIVPI